MAERMVDLSEVDPYEAGRIYWEDLNVETRTYSSVATRLGLQDVTTNKAVSDRVASSFGNGKKRVMSSIGF